MKSIKKVMILCKGHRNIAGAQLYLTQISKLFPPDEFQLFFALNSKDGLKFYDEISKSCNTKLLEYDWRHLSLKQSFVQGYKLIGRIRPDILVFNSSEDEIAGTLWASIVQRVPVRIMIVHWATPPDSLAIFRSKGRFSIPVPSRYALKTRVFRALTYFALSKLVFVNNITRYSFLKLYKIPSSKCITVYNGIDSKRFKSIMSCRDEVRSKLGIETDECLVLTTGNLTEIKGHRYLIAAIKDLVEKGIKIRCLIAGQGELWGDLEQQITTLNLKEHVVLLGYRDDVHQLLAATDIFCMPSINEALGYSIIEALFSGVPVVASNVGGIPEVIEDGKEGVLVSPKDKNAIGAGILSIWSNPDVRKSMSLKGKNTANRKFTIERMLLNTEKLLRKVMNA